ncbi:MAG: hypothetical protein SCARUB_04603 [Candidatus Scalindua rubra]|uniref:Uncharacterized protein n=1 Tax=Candidatus Scalindua rubra TaxID=1872076 RepID=A0A1E3X3Q9_9BACT|nr:MAG: hypothetical protein SCARUB_04603 [Candidatus Scalindua rubra]
MGLKEIGRKVVAYGEPLDACKNDRKLLFEGTNGMKANINIFKIPGWRNITIILIINAFSQKILIKQDSQRLD